MTLWVDSGRVASVKVTTHLSNVEHLRKHSWPFLLPTLGSYGPFSGEMIRFGIKSRHRAESIWVGITG